VNDELINMDKTWLFALVFLWQPPLNTMRYFIDILL